MGTVRYVECSDGTNTSSNTKRVSRENTRKTATSRPRIHIRRVQNRDKWRQHGGTLFTKLLPMPATFDQLSPLHSRHNLVHIERARFLLTIAYTTTYGAVVRGHSLCTVKLLLLPGKTLGCIAAPGALLSDRKNEHITKKSMLNRGASLYQPVRRLRLGRPGTRRSSSVVSARGPA
jgi:hypothetical protein